MIVRKGPFHAALTQLLRIIDRHSTHPLLQHVKLIADGNTLCITATDLATYAVASVPCDGRFAASLPAKALADFVKPENVADKRGLVELLPEGDGKTTVAVEAALTTLASRPSADFPTRPGDQLERSSWSQVAAWDAGEFGDKLRWVALAAGSDPTRPQLTGIYFDGEHVVATDGHRLHVARLAGFSGEPVLVCARTFSAFLRALPKKGEVTMERSGDLLRIHAGSWELVTAAMSETFPPYQQVVPRLGSEAYVVEVERGTLAYALARVAKTKNGSKGVRMVVNGVIKLERDHGDGKSTSIVPVVTTTHRGPDSIIGADPSYVLDALDSSAEIVTGRFGDALDPIRFDLGDGRVAVVMPMRL